MADSDSYEEYKSDEEASRNDVIAVGRKKAEVANATAKKPREKADDVIKVESGEKKKEKKKKKEKQDQDDDSKKEKKKEKKTKEGKKEKRTKETKAAEVEKKPEANSVVVVAQETATLPATEVVVKAVSEAVPVVELAVSPAEVQEVRPKTENTISVSVEPEVPLPVETTATEVANESSEKQSPSDVTPKAEPQVAATSASKPEPEVAELKTGKQESAAEPEATVAKAVEPDVVAPEEPPKPDASEASEQAAPSTVPETEISAASGFAELPETPSSHPVSSPHPSVVKIETTTGNLRPGIQEILAHAQRVADERASCSSTVLSAKSLISRQEKLQERLVEMRSHFTDFDSEIRALRLDAYKNQQKRLQKY